MAQNRRDERDTDPLTVLQLSGELLDEVALVGLIVSGDELTRRRLRDGTRHIKHESFES